MLLHCKQGKHVWSWQFVVFLKEINRFVGYLQLFCPKFYFHSLDVQRNERITLLKFSGQLFKTLYLSHTHLIPRVESITRKFSWIKLGISIVILTFRNKFWIWTFTINTISTSNIKDCSKRTSILSWYSPNTKVILSEIMITLYFKLCCLVLVYISNYVVVIY